jgi:transposase
MRQQTLAIKNFTSQELRSLLTDDEDFRRAICLFACYQISLGKLPEDVALFYGTSPEVIVSWAQQLNENGLEGLGVINVCPKDEQLSLAKILKYRRPVDYGFNREHWNLRLLVKLIFHEFQISYRLWQVFHFFRTTELPNKPD